MQHSRNSLKCHLVKIVLGGPAKTLCCLFYPKYDDVSKE